MPMDIEVKNLDIDHPVIRDLYSDCDPETLGNMGIVAFRGDIPLAAAFVWTTSCKVIILELIRVNPKVSKFAAGRAIKHLVNTTIGWAKSQGYTRIAGYTDAHRKGLLRWYSKIGGTVEQTPVYRVSRRI